jgi:hypothetical protein
MRPATPTFPEGMFQPLHVEDNPEPQPVPLQQYFFEETPAPSRRNIKRMRPITRHIVRRRARQVGDCDAP